MTRHRIAPPGPARVGLAAALLLFTGTSAPAGAQAPAQSSAPYSATDVAFDNPTADGIRLTGTLTLPDGDGPFPAVVLISGAGPHDRDESHAGHKPFAALAAYLSAHGVAVLRTDDRGVGGSTGTLSGATWVQLASDAEAGVAFLRTQPRINANAIGVVGHSQGGIIAPIAAMEDEDVAFLVSLAGPSTDFVALTLAQRRRAAVAQGAPEAAVRRTEPVLTEVFDVIARAASVENAREAARDVLTADALARLGAPESARETVVDQLVNPELFVALHYNPQVVLPRVHVPVLALTGTLDSVVDAQENLSAIAAALEANPDVTTIALDGLNHFFQTAVTGDPSEYAELDEDFAPAALDAIASWINARFAAP